jgi:hypothetical protein
MCRHLHPSGNPASHYSSVAGHRGGWSHDFEKFRQICPALLWMVYHTSFRLDKRRIKRNVRQSTSPPTSVLETWYGSKIETSPKEHVS